MGRPVESCESWAQRQKHTDGSQFVRACAAAGIVAGVREAARWRSGRGQALAKAWEIWPSSKNLPQLEVARG